MPTARAASTAFTLTAKLSRGGRKPANRNCRVPVCGLRDRRRQRAATSKQKKSLPKPLPQGTSRFCTSVPVPMRGPSACSQPQLRRVRTSRTSRTRRHSRSVRAPTPQITAPLPWLAVSSPWKAADFFSDALIKPISSLIKSAPPGRAALATLEGPAPLGLTVPVVPALAVVVTMLRRLRFPLYRHEVRCFRRQKSRFSSPFTIKNTR